MGDVAARIRVMPSSADIDIDALVDKIRNAVSPKDVAVTPIAFGLKAIDVMVVVPDGTEGGTSSIEEKLRAIEGVESAETTDVTLI